MNQQQNSIYINKMWDNSIIPTLMEYIKIPNKSPQFDKDWHKHGYMAEAVNLLVAWCKENALPQMKLEVIQLEGRTPLIFIDIPGTNTEETILLYGHLDKQPEMTGWDNGLSPWNPILRGDHLYGRGSADDGYAIFAALTAIKSLHEQNLPHARSIILIEACEESGSFDLPFYIEALKERINQPSLIVCLDSGCGNYDQLWVTTSLRGLLGGVLKIQVLEQGIHSGSGSGIVPSCFRILRQLCNRIEDEKTGDILLQELNAEIPSARREQAEDTANVLGKSLYETLAFAGKTQPESQSLSELMLRQTWKPTLSLIGIDGVPTIENAGNVTLPALSVKLSFRIPPGCDVDKAAKILKQTLENDPPYNADINFAVTDQGAPWNAPVEQPWLTKAAHDASMLYFGKPAVYMGEGGSIPFMAMLGKRFPNAQFLITGVLGPGSNAHGPNEFLHIPTAKKLTACVAKVIVDHYHSIT